MKIKTLEFTSKYAFKKFDPTDMTILYQGPVKGVPATLIQFKPTDKKAKFCVIYKSEL